MRSGFQEVSPVLRSLVIQACRVKPLRVTGQCIYHHVSLRIAKDFAKRSGVDEVRLVGGAIDRCLPGASDLDFVVISKDRAQPLAQLREAYVQWKRRAPFLGEVTIASRGEWELYLQRAPSALLERTRYRVFQGSRWSEIKTLSFSVSDPRRQFAQSFLHYYWAHRYLEQSKVWNTRPLYKNFFRKELRKAIALGGSEKRASGSDELLQATAYEQFETLAQLIRRTPLSPQAPPLQCHAVSENSKERWLSEVKRAGLERRWAGGGLVQSTSVPFVYSLLTTDEKAFRKLFHRDSIAKHRPELPCLFLSQDSARVLASGWGVLNPLSNLSWNSDPASVAPDIFFSLVDRLALYQWLLKGRIWCLPPRRWQASLLASGISALAVGLRYLTDDLGELRKKAKRQFPAVSRMIDLVSHEAFSAAAVQKNWPFYSQEVERILAGVPCPALNV
jgi:hypothetical protein